MALRSIKRILKDVEKIQKELNNIKHEPSREEINKLFERMKTLIEAYLEEIK